MPYAYQCCSFGMCENVYKISNQWNKGDNASVDDLHKKDTGMFQVQGKTWRNVVMKSCLEWPQKSIQSIFYAQMFAFVSPQQAEK